MQHITDCHVEPVAGRAPAADRESEQIVYVAVAGMGCPNCANRVRNGLLGTEGVVDLDVDLPAALVPSGMTVCWQG